MITMGEHSYNATNDIDCYEGVALTIGNFCSIGSGLKIYSGTHPCIDYPNVVSQYPFKEQWDVEYPPSKGDGRVTIGHDVWIATDVSILEGVNIGNGAIIGARSNVTKDVEPYSFVAGNPAEEKYLRFEPFDILRLLVIQWWFWDEEKIKEAMPYMKNIKKFIEQYA